jgi:chromate transporter
LSYFLDSVNVAAVGIMAAVTLKIGYDVGEDWKAWLLMAMSILIAFKFPKISSVWVIVGGSVIGYGLLMI